jgi:hypothetical protein
MTIINMDIKVTYHSGRWVTDPSPAIVVVGTRVRWIFRTPGLPDRSLLWKVTFGGRLPFGREHAVLKVQTRREEYRERVNYDEQTLQRLELPQDANVIHRGETETQPAERAGQFKYDLSVSDAMSGELIGDDDPWLVVVYGILHF